LIAHLARTPAERLELARRGHERARELVWEHSERALLEAYARLCAVRPAKTKEPQIEREVVTR
jgi:hypothetical protein